MLIKLYKKLFKNLLLSKKLYKCLFLDKKLFKNLSFKYNNKKKYLKKSLLIINNLFIPSHLKIVKKIIINKIMRI